MSILKRGNKYWVDFSFNRQRYRLSSPDNSLAGAKAYEALLRHNLAYGISIKKEEVVDDKSVPDFKSFSWEWFESYVKTNNKHSEILNKESLLRVHLNPFFGDIKLDEIKSREIEAYKSKKMQENQSNKSINNHLIVLNKCLNTAKEWKVVSEVNIAKLLKVATKEIDFLRQEKCYKLLDHCEGIVKDMVVIALNTGLRFGELIGLKTTDIDLELNLITVKRSITRGIIGTPKSNKIRHIPLNKSVIETVKDKLNYDGFLFHKENGDFLNSVTCLRWLHKACDKGGLEKVGWHVLRHTFASHLAQNGVSMIIIQKLLGHADIKTTMRYSHISEPVIKGAIDTLNLNSWHNNVTIQKEEEKDNVIKPLLNLVGNEISK